MQSSTSPTEPARLSPPAAHSDPPCPRLVEFPLWIPSLLVIVGTIVAAEVGEKVNIAWGYGVGFYLGYGLPVVSLIAVARCRNLTVRDFMGEWQPKNHAFLVLATTFVCLPGCSSGQDSALDAL